MSGRCVACDKKLNDFEMTRRYAGTQNYVDLCNYCFSQIPNFPDVEERGDLYQNEEVDIGAPLEDWEID